jgi:pseudouridine-5'-phosphate glycosidase
VNHRALQIAPEVKAALDANQPVVALESTLITHGLPYPRSRDTALAMEAAAREAGAVPATIAVLRGEVRVGLTEAEIDALAQTPDTRKCSRRDLPVAVALGETGSTTVAGTMIVAHMAGIRVFATGGIGGVHRGHPEDVSADLIELGRTPVAVVSSGAKSILDLPRTLEVLETQGVPVIGYGTNTLPSFFSRATDLPVDVRIDTPEQAAAIIAASGRLGIQQGILIVSPVPEGDEIPAADAEAAIAQAAREADEHGIGGRDLTPFLLARVSELTGERSQRANLSLLVNNAKVAAQIAVALAPHYDV